MCMLTYLSPGTQPDVDAIGNGTTFNNDGHGFAIVHGDQLIVRHGMDPENMVNKFEDLRKRFPDGPAMFHSRFGTAGSVSRYNCHPFYIGGDNQSVLGHNGVLPQLVQPQGGDRRSDTRICAEELLAGWDLQDEHNQNEIEKWMGAGNKFVILTVNPIYDYSAWILNEKAGNWEDNDSVWYSNTDYRYGGTRTAKGKRSYGWGTTGYYESSYSWQKDEEPDDKTGLVVIGSPRDSGDRLSGHNDSEEYGPCYYCAGPVDLGGYCQRCSTCQDCLEYLDCCQCFGSKHAPRRWWEEVDEKVFEDLAITAEERAVSGGTPVMDGLLDEYPSMREELKSSSPVGQQHGLLTRGESHDSPVVTLRNKAWDVD